MEFYFSEKIKVNIDMIDYMNKMANDLPIKLKPDDKILNQATGYLFDVGNIEDMSKVNINDFTQ